MSLLSRHGAAFGRMAALALLALCACAQAGVQPPDGEPVVRGPIETISHRATASGLLVRASPGSRDMCGISATVDATTHYLRRDPSGVLKQASIADLAVGDTVEVYADGPVAESCPLQGRASAILIVAEVSQTPE